jgi:predicted transcriptional regulator
MTSFRYTSLSHGAARVEEPLLHSRCAQATHAESPPCLAQDLSRSESRTALLSDMLEHTGTTKSQLTAFMLVFLIGSSGCVSLASGSSESNPLGSALSFIASVLGASKSFTVVGAVHGTFAGGGAPEGSPSGSESSSSQQTVSESQSEAATGSSLSLTSTSSPLFAIMPSLWADHSRKRSRFEVYLEILELLKRGPLTPFEVAFYARLNHKRTKEYINFLERSGYLEVVDEDGRTVCVLSTSGGNVVERVRSFYGLFEGTFATRKPYT